MTIKLAIPDVSEPLDQLEKIIKQSEDLNLKFISISKGVVGNEQGNVLTLRREHVPESEGKVRLEIIDGNLSLDEQVAKLSQLDSNGKRLLGFGSVYVNKVEKNVAAYRA